jgi:hypothetical protein
MSQLMPGVPLRRALFLPATLVEKLPNGRDNPPQPQDSLAKVFNPSPEEVRKQEERIAEAEREVMRRATEESIDVTKQREALEQFAAENKVVAKRHGSNQNDMKGERQAHIYDEIPGVNHRKHNATYPHQGGYGRNRGVYSSPHGQGGYEQQQEAHSAQYSQRDQDFHAATDIGASSLSVGSSIQIPAPEPNQGMRYGTIKWIGTTPAVKAGIELVMHIS